MLKMAWDGNDSKIGLEVKGKYGKYYVKEKIGNGGNGEVFAVEIIDGNVEIKNILTLIEHRGNGYAKALIKFVEKTYSNYDTFLLSTANSSFENITFYTRLGYVYSHRIENFFLDYYPKEIFENQMQATDLMYFKKSIKNIN